MNSFAGPEPLLRTNNLSKVYPDGTVNALIDTNLQIEANEYVAIMGPSGSGKSTLLSLLGGLDRPTSGQIYFQGRSFQQLDLDKFRATQIGFVFQSFYLLPTLTAEENVQIPMFETARSRTERVAKSQELLRAVGLSHRTKHLPTRLSVGERQRVAIARALANDPQLLLADEPTGNLDSKNADEILRVFESLHQEYGMTIIMVTHSEEVAAHAKRLIRVKDGQIVCDEVIRTKTLLPPVKRA